MGTENLSTTQTFKVQKSLATTGNQPVWLLYNMMRTTVIEMLDDAVPSELVEAMGDDFKMYASFKIDLGTGEATFIKRVSDLPW